MSSGANRGRLAAGPLLLLVSASCVFDHQPSLRPGTLSEVGRTGLVLRYHADGPGEGDVRRTVLVDNVARDGTCLELGGLRLTLNGRFGAGTLVPGGRHPAYKHTLPFMDPKYTCRSAAFVVDARAGVDDASREADVVEVSDGTRTLRATFANVLARVTLVPPLPAELAPGELFRVNILPRAPGRTLSLVMLDYPRRPGASEENRQLAVAWRRLGPDAYELEIPREAPRERVPLVIVRQRDVAAERAPGDEFPAVHCTADRCVAERDAETVSLSLTIRDPGTGAR